MPIFLILFLTLGALNAVEPSSLQVAIQERDYKKAIILQKERIAGAYPAEKGDLAYELAMLYLKDQDQEQAFRTFLKALDETQGSQQEAPYDKEIYNKAFAIYLDPAAPSPQETAKELLNLLLPYLKEHPQEQLLEYYVAIAYANLGKYDEFFSHFYKACKAYPDHYLAYRTKAVLHIKILERQREEKQRLEQRQAIITNLQLALKKEPHDTTIYKMLINLSSLEDKAEAVRQSLNKILSGNIIIPRGDLLFYVKAALDANECQLAEKFVARSKEWYPQSRIVNTAQKYLKEIHNE